MSKPKAVLISDVHYSLSTLEIADRAFRQAIDTAAKLNIPLIDCGDLTNDKAILRAEVSNRLIDTLTYSKDKDVQVYLMIGNHSLINEKDNDRHALNFLSPYAEIVDCFYYNEILDLYFIPYQSDASKLLELLKEIPKGSTILMHQGIKGAMMGDYVVDKTSIHPEELKDFICLSGHYHRHQVVGTLTYIGSPYTITFGEANDGPKGFLILNEDGTYDRVYTNLRSHVIVNRTISNLYDSLTHNRGDLLWLKVQGPYSELEKLNKNELGLKLFGHTNYRLEKIYTDNKTKLIDNTQDRVFTSLELMDKLIETSDENDKQKSYLKKLYRDVLNETS